MSHFQTLAAASFAAVAAAMIPTSFTPSGKPIYEAPSGSLVLQNDTDMLVYAPNGTLLHVFGRQSSSLYRPSAANVDQVYVNLGANHTLQSFNATLIVPPLPTTFDSQLIYFTQGIMMFDESGSPEVFLGGGFQYGRDSLTSGPFYKGFLFAEDLGVENPDYPFVYGGMKLNVGDTLKISLTYQGITTAPGSPPYYRYMGEFFGPGPEDRIALGFVQPVLPGTIAFRVEEAGVSKSSDYPAGPLVLKDVNVELTAGLSDVRWEFEGSPKTDIECEVVKDGSRDAEIRVHFPGAEDTGATSFEYVSQERFEMYRHQN
ncbi:hypothetical protein HMN09_00280300 [Mycena chlorophos]|uniref:Uncharacterized protein n=1 Tax=Mycena chlorophos TaxID=658473 RepID=A0A8H6TPH4_MYCCL|nr:hypothetical protein HMN09_00280300 [Mycena chlorophos]